MSNKLRLETVMSGDYPLIEEIVKAQNLMEVVDCRFCTEKVYERLQHDISIKYSLTHREFDELFTSVQRRNYK